MKKAVSIVVNVLAWIVLILAFLTTLIVFSSGRNNGVANLMGFIPMTVESDSMKPTFSKNDLIVCKEVDDINSLQKGDVITFWTIIDGKKVKNTHRIVDINEFESTRSFVTRGDNNNLDDTLPAYAGDVIGKWTEFKVGGIGKFFSFLRTKTGFFVCILIPMALFFLFELYKFIVTLIETKRPVTAGADFDEEEIKRRAVEEYLASQKAAADEAAKDAKDAAEKSTKELAETSEAVSEAVKDAEELAEYAGKRSNDENKEAVEKLIDEAKPVADKIADEAEAVKEKAEEIKDTADEEKVEEITEKTE
ncbi:MAG: signal peptidase I [Ruminococcus sp.]|nr:signal peptidase I [Ruminococcus sp.]